MALSEYIRHFKGICDDLAAIGKPVSDRQKGFALLTGLGPGYESFVTTMLKPPTPSYGELIPLLESHETIKSMHSTEFYGTNHNVAFYGQRQGGRNSKSI